MQMPSGHHNGVPKKNSHAMNMKALPSSEMKSRSPRVVSMAKMPRLGVPPGTKYSQTAMEPMQSKMNRKKPVVARVQAIHVPSGSVHHLKLNITTSSISVSLHPAEGKALGDVIAHEPDHDRTGDNCQCSGGRQQTKFISG